MCKGCGSVRMERNPETRKMECREPDCVEVSRERALGQTRKHGFANTHWRDPVAMSMDVYGGK